MRFADLLLTDKLERRSLEHLAISGHPFQDTGQLGFRWFRAGRRGCRLGLVLEPAVSLRIEYHGDIGREE